MKISEFNAKIFVPGKGISFRLTSTKLILASWLILILLLFIEDQLNLNSQLERVIYFSSFLLIIIGHGWAYNEKQYKYGDLSGSLTINEVGISTETELFKWTEVSDFNFTIKEVLGEQLWDPQLYHRRGLGPAYSAGVDSFIAFRHNDSQQKIHFLLENPSHGVEFRRIMREQYFADNIELQATYDGLQLEYEEIQQLKEQKLLKKSS